MDILTVGLGQQKLEEYTAQFSVWALMSSSLIAGNDLRKMTKRDNRYFNQQRSYFNQSR